MARSSIDKKVDEEATHIESTANVTEIGSFRVLGLSSEDADFFTNYPEEARKKVFRKVITLGDHW